MRFRNFHLKFLKNISISSIWSFWFITWKNAQCVKIVRVWSFSGPYFPAFRVNAEIYNWIQQVCLIYSFAMLPFDPRENIRKPLIFWCFEGDQKKTLGRNGLRMYEQKLHIQFECGKVRTRKTPITGSFHTQWLPWCYNKNWENF